MQASSEITPGIGRCRPLIVWVDEPIGGEGWKVLAEGVKLYPSLPLKFFAVQKDDLDEASQEDIRVMWDAVEPSGGVSVGRDPEEDDYEWVDKNEGEGGWTRLAQIMEMSKEEWAAQFEELEDQGEMGAEEEKEGAGASQVLVNMYAPKCLPIQYILKYILVICTKPNADERKIADYTDITNPVVCYCFDPLNADYFLYGCAAHLLGPPAHSM